MRRMTLIITILLAGLTSSVGVAGAQNPPIYKSIYDSAKAKFDKGEYVEARALFLEVKRMALEDETYSEVIDYRIGLCLENEGNFKDAIKYYRTYADSQAVNARVATKEAVDAKIQELEAKLDQEKNKVVEKEKAKKTVADLYKRADEYASKRNLTSALTLYLEVRSLGLRASIHQEVVDYKIGVCYHQQNDFVNAIKYYELYVQAPTIQKGWPERAKVQKHIQDLQAHLDKQEASTSALSMDPKTKALFTTGQSRYEQSQFAEARKQFLAVKASMQANNRYLDWVEYYIGTAYEAEEKFQEAIDAYKLYVASTNEYKNLPSKAEVSKRIARLEKMLSAVTPSTAALQEKIKKLHDQARRLVAEGKPAEARGLLEQIKKEATAANIYTHKMDYDIAVTYDREGNYKLAVSHYNLYLNAPSIQPGWPDRYTVQNRVQFLKEEQSAKGGGTFSGGGSYYGDGATGPGILGPPDSITGQWWFWVGVAVVGVIVIAVVVSGSQQETNNDYTKSRPLGFGGDPISGPGVSILRF
jgi:tetratricopeptide (TPR) repeat protein